MASFSAGTQFAFLKLLFQAVNWANIADNTATSPATQLYFSLHNADPGDSGNQSTSETAYTNYARVAVARSSGGFSVTNGPPGVVSNVNSISFPQCGVTGDTVTHFGVGLASSGAGTLLGSGPVGTGPALSFSASAASPGVLTIPNSGATVNQRCSVYPNASSTLPSGLTEGTVYFVGTVAGITITLSTTSANGSPVNTSAAGSGVIVFQAPLVVSQNITPTFAVGALAIKQW